MTGAETGLMGREADEKKLADVLMSAERWVVPIAGSDALFLADPIIRNKIETDRPPVWIEYDDVLAGGFDYLRRNGPWLGITNLLGPHEYGAVSGVPAVRNFERLVGGADFYGYESAGTTAGIEDETSECVASKLNSLVGPGQTIDLDALLHMTSNDKINGGFVRDAAAKLLLGTPSFVADIMRDGSFVEKVLYYSAEAVVDDPIRHIAGAAYLGLVNLREWVAVGRIGLALQAQFGELAEPLNGVVRHGAYHRDIVRKERIFGVNAREEKVGPVSLQAEIDLEGLHEVIGSGLVLPRNKPVLTYHANMMRNQFRYQPL